MGESPPDREAAELVAQPLASPALSPPPPVREVEHAAAEAEPALLAATRALFVEEARSHYDTEVLARIRKTLGDHQHKCASQMEKILNGQNLRLQDIPLPGEDDPREPPLARLRRFMDLLQQTRGRLDDPDFGLCVGCEGPLSEQALQDTPWLTRCARCQ